MSFTSNEETEKYNNIRKIKYSATEIKYTTCEKRIAQRKTLRIIRCTKLQKAYISKHKLKFYLIRMIINENSLNE